MANWHVFIIAVCGFWLLLKPESNILCVLYSDESIQKNSNNNNKKSVFQLEIRPSPHSLKYSIVPISTCLLFSLLLQKIHSGHCSGPYVMDTDLDVVLWTTPFLSGCCYPLSNHGDNICK